MAWAKPVVADIFCGAGLFSAGFHLAGFQTAFAMDVDADAVASYRRNLSKNAMIGDVRKPVTGLTADVLLAGPPCQGFSTLGRRDPKDIRNRLSLVVPDWAEAVQAKVVIIENVPPFIGSKYWLTIKRKLATLGYETTSWVLNAEDYGTPQLRTRGFTVASRIGPIFQPKRRGKRITVRDVLIDKALPQNDPLDVGPPISDLVRERMQHVPLGGAKRDIMERAPELCPPSWFKIRSQATDVWGRMHLDEPANTVRCCFQNPSKGRYVHPIENRVISLREGARLQGIPDNWMFTGNRTSIARQIGNGVPIPLGRAIAKEVLKALRAERCHSSSASVSMSAA